MAERRTDALPESHPLSESQEDHLIPKNTDRVETSDGCQVQAEYTRNDVMPEGGRGVTMDPKPLAGSIVQTPRQKELLLQILTRVEKGALTDAHIGAGDEGAGAKDVRIHVEEAAGTAVITIQSIPKEYAQQFSTTGGSIDVGHHLEKLAGVATSADGPGKQEEIASAHDDTFGNSEESQKSSSEGRGILPLNQTLKDMYSTRKRSLSTTVNCAGDMKKISKGRSQIFIPKYEPVQTRSKIKKSDLYDQVASDQEEIAPCSKTFKPSANDETVGVYTDHQYNLQSDTQDVVFSAVTSSTAVCRVSPVNALPNPGQPDVECVKGAVQGGNGKQITTPDKSQSAEDAKVKPKKTSLEHYCPRCGQSFTTKVELTDHLSKHKSKQNVCYKCGKPFLSPSNLKRHVRETHEGMRSHVCSDCDKCFFTKHSLQAHRRKAHDAVDDGDENMAQQKQTPVKCPLCEEKFPTQNGVWRHQLVEHSETISEAERDDIKSKLEVEKSIFVCDVCGKILASKGSLFHHRFTHTGERRFACPKCSWAASTKANLQRHLLTHSEDRPYKCDGCASTFRDPSTLAQHRRIHSGDKQYKCEECGKAFIQAASLKSHLVCHTKQRDYTCDQCGKTFLRKSHLSFHKVKHNSQPRFPCSVCGAAFYREGELNRHSKVHSEDRQYKCTARSKSSSRQPKTESVTWSESTHVSDNSLPANCHQLSMVSLPTNNHDIGQKNGSGDAEKLPELNSNPEEFISSGLSKNETQPSLDAEEQSTERTVTYSLIKTVDLSAGVRYILVPSNSVIRINPGATHILSSGVGVGSHMLSSDVVGSQVGISERVGVGQEPALCANQPPASAAILSGSSEILGENVNLASQYINKSVASAMGVPLEPAELIQEEVGESVCDPDKLLSLVNAGSAPVELNRAGEVGICTDQTTTHRAILPDGDVASFPVTLDSGLLGSLTTEQNTTPTNALQTLLEQTGSSTCDTMGVVDAGDPVVLSSVLQGATLVPPVGVSEDAHALTHPVSNLQQPAVRDQVVSSLAGHVTPMITRPTLRLATIPAIPPSTTVLTPPNTESEAMHTTYDSVMTTLVPVNNSPVVVDTMHVITGPNVNVASDWGKQFRIITQPSSNTVVHLGGPDAGVRLNGPNTGVQWSGTDTGIQLGGPDTGVQLGGPVTGVQLIGPDTGVQLSGPDTGGHLGGPDTDLQLGGPDTGLQLGGPDMGVHLGGPDTGVQLNDPCTSNAAIPCTNMSLAPPLHSVRSVDGHELLDNLTQ